MVLHYLLFLTISSRNGGEEKAINNNTFGLQAKEFNKILVFVIHAYPKGFGKFQTTIRCLDLNQSWTTTELLSRKESGLTLDHFQEIGSILADYILC